MDFRQYIVCDPAICGGHPVVAGTRVPVRTLLASLENGDSASSILADFPGVSEAALRAVVAFAAASAKEDLPVPSLVS
jgi:uncharacterized protein (DUF433 family)